MRNTPRAQEERAERQETGESLERQLDGMKDPLPSLKLQQGFLHLLVPPTVNDGVQTGADETVEKGKNFLPPRGVTAPGPRVHEDGVSIKDTHHGRVGATGGGGFVPSWHRADAQIGGQAVQGANRD